MIGLISVSEAGLKTLSGMLAPAIGRRHSIHLFLMERPNLEHNDQYRYRRYRLEEYHPGDILKLRTPELESSEPKLEQHSSDGAVSAADLRCIDMLACDSITFPLITHPRRFKYQLLSDRSLDEIEAEAATLPRVMQTSRPGKSAKTTQL